jgi:hypothetical protein
MAWLLAPMTCHLPVRPSWDCQLCCQSWPCPPARRDLGFEFEGKPTYLFFYMSAQMGDFASDRTALGELSVDCLYPRFLHWIRSATVRAA